MPSELYDIFWLNPLPAEFRPNKVSLNKVNTLAKPNIGLPAVILYPALLTPEIVVGHKDVINLMIAFNQKDLDALKLRKTSLEMSLKIAINKHLKVFKGLNTKREYTADPLFSDGDWDSSIQLHPLSKLKSSAYTSKDSGFSGIFHKEAVKLYTKNSVAFDQVYSVSLATKALQSVPGEGRRYQRNAMLPFEDGIGVDPQQSYNQDYVLHQFKGIQSAKIEESGRYGFKVDSKDVKAGVIDYHNPIQSYHPVFFYDELEHANVGHISDLHVNSRQQVLSHSKAKVIESSEFKSVGEMMNIASLDTWDLLQQFERDQDVDIIVIGGDLVDFMNNICIPQGVTGSPKVSEIWDMVDMDKRKLYKDYVDFIAFYSLIVAYYQKSNPKPAYVVTGNHDCYYESYGISPRVVVWGKELKRANEGIPWDHNLTMYEAILSFGKTYGEVLTGVNTSGRPPSSFYKEKLAWFYSVLSPFSDFSLTLPNQRLVGLGWGNSEVMISVNRPDGQADWGVLPGGHLPRADEAISDKQYKFLKSTATEKKDNKKIILTTHFTFVSYKESISNERAAKPDWNNDNDQGDVYYTKSWYSTRDFSKADMGTFEKHREDLYKKILAKDRRIQVILTGHSHRRGFYTIRRDDTSGNNSVKTGFHDFPVFEEGKPSYYLDHNGNKQQLMEKDKKAPWIILSDSGGSVPRMNLSGEFKGWGSDIPSGTKIEFDEQSGGEVKSLSVVRVKKKTAKPRFAVALDYMDIMEGAVINRFKTKEFVSGRDRKSGWRYAFYFRWSKAIKQSIYGLRMNKVMLYYRESHTSMKGIPLRFSKDCWILDEKFNRVFRKRISKDKERGTFLAIWFSTNKNAFKRYDFSTPWTFEIQIKHDTSGGWIRTRKEEYILKRHKKWKEIPDFKRRKKFYKGY